VVSSDAALATTASSPEMPIPETTTITNREARARADVSFLWSDMGTPVISATRESE
jgi:hypothetical protein